MFDNLAAHNNKLMQTENEPLYTAGFEPFVKSWHLGSWRARPSDMFYAGVDRLASARIGVTHCRDLVTEETGGNT